MSAVRFSFERERRQEPALARLIQGRNVECVQATRLVQAWRPKTWAPGLYSLVRFDLQAEADGTRLLLEHVGYPEEQGEHLASGWQANYLEPLRKLFA